MEPTSTSQIKPDQGQPFRIRVLLEPKGFIRLIEFVLAVLMFATTAGYNSSCKFSVVCQEIYSYPDINYKFGYPFSLPAHDELCVPVNATSDLAVQAYPGGKAVFFVLIGVLAMLYCIASLIWYVFLEVKFLRFDLVPVADFVLTVFFALFFFLAACAWASGVSTVKYWTSFDNIIAEFYQALCQNSVNTCKKIEDPNYASLNASIIFGFLNWLVWTGNCWFVFKETVWFKKRQEQKQQETKQEFPPNDV